MDDYLIIGGGIVGLATALALSDRHPGASIRVIDKEHTWAAHQTGRNSGVIHSGIYYKPGSLKAQLSRRGSASMVAFCREHGIPVEVTGKLIVATDHSELERLDALHERGRQNGLEVRRIGPAEARDHEPHVQAVAALHVASTGIVEYAQVCRTIVRLLDERGHRLRLGEEVVAIEPRGHDVAVVTTHGTYPARAVVNCAGLQSDRVAALTGIRPPAKIVPFRGEYFELVPSKRHLVRGLVYPVPDPAFPFLGVHFTRMIDGSVHAGPNAVLALRREGYRWRDVDVGDLREVLAYPGFRRLARTYYRDGAAEMARSLMKPLFVKSLQRLVPEVAIDDLVRSDAGVRAQALLPDGGLVDDFLIVPAGRVVHVLNAPSPAATSSLEIGREVAHHAAARLAA